MTAPAGTKRQLWARFASNRLAAIGAVSIAVITLVAVAAPMLPLDPLTISLDAVRAPPSSDHLLGTDQAGRDVLSRVVYGTRTSLTVGTGSVALYVLLGTAVGLAAGSLGGRIDWALMRVTDAFLSIPLLLTVTVFVAIMEPGILSVIIVIGVLGWPATARLVRAQTLSIRESDYVKAAQVSGLGTLRILVMHVLPNLATSLIVVASIGVGVAVILEAALGFLGLGVRPPASSLGVMISEATDTNVLRNLPWAWVSPAAILCVLVMSINFVGDGLRDAIDPREGVV